MKLILTLLVISVTVAFAATLNLGNFREAPWGGLEVLQTPYPVALPSVLPPETQLGRWSNLPEHNTLRMPRLTQDYNGYSHVSFWLYSSKANNQLLTFFLASENSETPGPDYYCRHLAIDWQGWRHIVWSLRDDLTPARSPKGWNQISSITINASGWYNEPFPDTVLYFANVQFITTNLTATLKHKPVITHEPFSAVFPIKIANNGSYPVAATLKISHTDDEILLSGLPEQPLVLKPHQKHTLSVTAAFKDDTHLKPLEQRMTHLELAPVDTPLQGIPVTLCLSKPLAPRQHPCLFVSQADLDRLKERAQRLPWAQNHLQKILTDAEKELTKPLDIPVMEGQWPFHYVCKACGVNLKYTNGKQHLCPKCGKEYTGWPFDQVQACVTHNHNWQLVKLFGHAYAFTGKEAYARRAREILLGYAERYVQFPYHTIENKPGNLGARMLSQTLEEAAAVIGLCWGYDLVYNSPCFSAADHQTIENSLLREVAVTILRNDMVISNWQSWHNAGIAAIGFCLNDSELIHHALYGKSGLVFQLNKAVLSDGFWHEGTGSYHFYALKALQWTVEAARKAGFDFTHDERFISLYDAPLYYVTPAQTFPAINDGDVFNLAIMDDFYEWAYSRIGKTEYLTIARNGRTGDIPFFFGVDTLPDASDIPLKSRVFSGLGAVVLRQGDRYVHLDYGPHGGGHGHPDKLTTNIYAAGILQAPDPGRIGYGIPMQAAWYCQTVSHNTVTVDGQSQQPTTGKLLHFVENARYCLAQAMSDNAYPGTRMIRTVGICDGVIFDIFELESETEHTYDWLFHNFGTWTPKLTGTLAATVQKPGTTAGYQHITNLMSAKEDNDWSADIVHQNTAATLLMNGEPGTELFFGEGIANNPPAPCPLVIVRRHGKTARFVSCVDYRANKTPPRDITIRLPDSHQAITPALELTINGKTSQIIITPP